MAGFVWTNSVMTSQVKWPLSIWGTLGNIYMNDYGKKFFKGLYLSQERRYRALTYRYSFNISKRALILHNLENHLKLVCTHLFNLLKPYLWVRARYLPSWLRYYSSKIFLPIFAHTNFTLVPQIDSGHFVL